MRAPGRGVPRELARRVAVGTGLDEIVHLGRRVDVLTESVAENTALALALTGRVEELERLLVGPLEARLRLLEEP